MEDTGGVFAFLQGVKHAYPSPTPPSSNDQEDDKTPTTTTTSNGHDDAALQWELNTLRRAGYEPALVVLIDRTGGVRVRTLFDETADVTKLLQWVLEHIDNICNLNEVAN